MKEIKSVRVRKSNIKSGVLDIKVTLFEEKRTLAADERILAGVYNPSKPDARVVWDETTYKLKGIYKDFTDDQFIDDFIKMNSKADRSGSEYKIIQDPWEPKVPKWRNYGFDPYYLNNGAKIYISWVDNGISAGGTNFSDDSGNELPITDTYIEKTIKIISDNEEKVMTLNKNGMFEYSIDSQVYFSSVKDKSIIDNIISVWRGKVPNYELALCSPDNESCSVIPYHSPLKPLEPTPIIPDTPVPTINEVPKEKIEVVLPKEVIKTKSDISLKVYIGKITESSPGESNEIDSYEYSDEPVISDEYLEDEFVGDEEAPPLLEEVNPEFNLVQDEGSPVVNSTVVTSTGGVQLPFGKSAYSHNSTQGYNLVDSKWYGNLLTSAIAHIDHPTFDIPGTKNGNLGCASWVSMVFYRAFGVNMKNGKSVKNAPKSIGDFGSTGTGELGAWFGSNPNMWDKIPWKEGQPGDVINTERGNSAGHVGIVLNEKHKNGSWVVASNSSKGFGSKSDPAGCGKKNYSITTWQSVTDRNPSRTFCWRYKGPKLSPGSIS